MYKLFFLHFNKRQDDTVAAFMYIAINTFFYIYVYLLIMIGIIS